MKEEGILRQDKSVHCAKRHCRKKAAKYQEERHEIHARAELWLPHK